MAVAAEAAAKPTEQEDNQDNDEDESDRHGVVISGIYDGMSVLRGRHPATGGLSWKDRNGTIFDLVAPLFLHEYVRISQARGRGGLGGLRLSKEVERLISFRAPTSSQCDHIGTPAHLSAPPWSCS